MKLDKLTDVTLVCDDKKQFKGYKIILGVATLCQERMNEFLNVANRLVITDIISKDMQFNDGKVNHDKSVIKDESEFQQSLKEICSHAYTELKGVSVVYKIYCFVLSVFSLILSIK